MNRYQIFKTLRHHRKLADHRALNYEQNRAAKYIVWFSMSFGFLYMLFLAVMLSLIANNSRGTTPLEFCFGLAPFLLLLDFASRFMAQQTPAQIVKPYYLLPLSRYDCIDTFVATSILTRYNFTWFVILVPFTLMSLVFSYGVWMSLAFLLVWWLLIAAPANGISSSRPSPPTRCGGGSCPWVSMAPWRCPSCSSGASSRDGKTSLTSTPPSAR